MKDGRPIPDGSRHCSFVDGRMNRQRILVMPSANDPWVSFNTRLTVPSNTWQPGLPSLLRASSCDGVSCAVILAGRGPTAAVELHREYVVDCPYCVSADRHNCPPGHSIAGAFAEEGSEALDEVTCLMGVKLQAVNRNKILST